MSHRQGLQNEFDLIVIGSGSAMNLVDPMIQRNPDIKIAVIDKDEPGGICLTRGCIPSKIMLYPAELVRTFEEAGTFGIDAAVSSVSYEKIMRRMRSLIDGDINAIREGLSSSGNITYYNTPAEFVAPYRVKVGGDEISAKMIFLATGSRPMIPRIKGIEDVGYHTSDSIIRMEMKKLPKSMSIIGGGYIAAEFGHFFSALGTKVTILARNARFLPDEEPEVSELAKKELSRHMTIYTDVEVTEALPASGGSKRLIGIEKRTGRRVEVESDEILVAAGRGPVNDILNATKGGVRLTKDGWIEVNEYLETSQPNVWAMGDSHGHYLFRHVANYESEIVYNNAVLRRKVKADYHAVPHAVFTYPEIASVGMREKEALEQFGRENILVGYERYEDTAKGEAMNAKDFFVKVIVDRSTQRILGAHIIGPQASILIHEIIVAMYAPTQSREIISGTMHIHPALSEVVQRAFDSLTEVEHYHDHVIGAN